MSEASKVSPAISWVQMGLHKVLYQTLLRPLGSSCMAGNVCNDRAFAACGGAMSDLREPTRQSRESMFNAPLTPLQD